MYSVVVKLILDLNAIGFGINHQGYGFVTIMFSVLLMFLLVSAVEIM